VDGGEAEPGESSRLWPGTTSAERGGEREGETLAAALPLPIPQLPERAAFAAPAREGAGDEYARSLPGALAVAADTAAVLAPLSAAAAADVAELRGARAARAASIDDTAAIAAGAPAGLFPNAALPSVPGSWWMGGLALSSAACVAILAAMLDVPWYEPLVAVLLAGPISLVAVRALGETDLNPVSGVGKLSQLVFAGVAPGNVVANIVAGAVAEAGAQQAGDLMQDLKTGHLLAVPPRAQFWAQLLGSAAGIPVSVAAYALFTSAFSVGPASSVLPAPTAAVWKAMARLVSGGAALPMYSGVFAGVAAAATAVVSLLALSAAAPHSEQRGASGVNARRGRCGAWRLSPRAAAFLPSPVAFAVGMFVTPNWTLARLLGALVGAAWLRRWPSGHSRFMLMAATGCVLGEGVLAILTAGLASAGLQPAAASR
jgi:OPT family oligopeptide transporter